MEHLLKFLLNCFLLFMISISVYAKNKEYVLHIPLRAEKISLDPSTVQDFSSLWVSRQINCQLFQLEGSAITLDAASSVEYLSPTKILISIKNDAIFNDGTKITAEDVVASFDYLKDSRLTFRNIFSWVKSTHVHSQDSLIIILKHPFSQFLDTLSTPHYPIFKKSFLHKAHRNMKLWSYPVSCGNYKVYKNTPSFIMLQPLKEGYTVYFQLGVNSKKNFKIKEDISDLDLDDLKKNTLQYHVVKLFDPYQIYLGFNLKKKIWNNKSARCSLLSKLNYSLIQKDYGSSAVSASDILPPGIIGYQNSSEKINEIRNKSLKYLLPSDKEFCIALLDVSVQQKYREAYTRIFKQLYSNTSSEIITDTAHFGSSFVKTNCDILIFGFKSSTFDGYGILSAFTKTDYNYDGLLDQKIVNLINSSQASLDSTERFKKYRNIVQDIESQCLVSPVVTLPYRDVFINNNLITPGIGEVPLDEYYLGKVKLKDKSQ